MTNPYRSIDPTEHPKRWPWKAWLWTLSHVAVIVTIMGLIVGHCVYALSAAPAPVPGPCRDAWYEMGHDDHCPHPDQQLRIERNHLLVCTCPHHPTTASSPVPTTTPNPGPPEAQP